MKKIILISTVFVLIGCSKVDTIKMAASHAVERYCSIPDQARKTVREQLSKAIQPNYIEVGCAE
jgi:hypothetical protein